MRPREEEGHMEEVEQSQKGYVVMSFEDEQHTCVRVLVTLKFMA